MNPVYCMNKERIYEIREQIGSQLSLSQDVCSNSCIITITGTMEVLIENYKGLLEYSSEKIVLQGLRERISILGREMTIHTYNNEDCLIQGHITAVFPEDNTKE